MMDSATSRPAAALYTMAWTLLISFGEFSRLGRAGHGELKAVVHRHDLRRAGADRSRLVDHGAADHRYAARFHGARRLRRNAGQRRLAASARGWADRGGAGCSSRYR